PSWASTSLFVPAAEVRRLVVLARAALDVFLFGEKALELGVGFLDHRRVLVRRRCVARGDGCGLTLRTPTTAASGDHPPRTGLPRGLAHGHRRFARDLVFGRGLVRKDVALVDPHLHADAAEGGAGLAEPVVDVGPQRVKGDPAFAVPL